jgi:hypothetical protein
MIGPSVEAGRRAPEVQVGFYFNLEHANVVGYLTSPGTAAPPRITASSLEALLGSLQFESGVLISSNPEWPARIAGLAERGTDRLRSYGLPGGSEVPGDAAAAVLADLRGALGRFTLYAMPFGEHRRWQELDAISRHIAYASRQHALVLIPDEGTENGIEVFDPASPMRRAAEQPDVGGASLWPRSRR